MSRAMNLALLFSFSLHLALALLFTYSSAERFPLTLLAVEFKKGSVEPKRLVKKNHVMKKAALSSSPSAFDPVEATSSSQLSAAPVLGSSLGIQVEYPRLSRVLNEQGEVVVEVSDGKAVKVFSSSGHARLDEAAMRATRGALEDGVVSSENPLPLRIRYMFSLTGK